MAAASSDSIVSVSVMPETVGGKHCYLVQPLAVHSLKLGDCVEATIYRIP